MADEPTQVMDHADMVNLSDDDDAGAAATNGVDGQVVTNGDSTEAGAMDTAPPKWNNKWRHDYKSTIGKMGFALEHRKLFHDVTFIVGDGEEKEEVTGHKTILAICSSVFEEMFYGEEVQASPDEVELLEQEPSAFKAMLKYLYTQMYDEVNLLNAIGVLRASKTFDLPDLLEKTGEYLKANLTDSNAVTFYQAAQEFEVEGLEKSAMEFLLNNFWAVAKANDFMNMTYPNLCKFLDEDRINISELDFFNALLRWAEAECSRQDLKDTAENLRLVLQDALALIRFPLMTPREFALQVVPKYILTPTEVITIFQHLSVELDERSTLPAVFCKSESRKKLKLSSTQPTSNIIDKVKATRLRVRVRPCDRNLKRERDDIDDEDYYPVVKSSPSTGGRSASKRISH
jgi:hypothetical protein